MSLLGVIVLLMLVGGALFNAGLLLGAWLVYRERDPAEGRRMSGGN
jgi:hypothetical protein